MGFMEGVVSCWVFFPHFVEESRGRVGDTRHLEILDPRFYPKIYFKLCEFIRQQR